MGRIRNLAGRHLVVAVLLGCTAVGLAAPCTAAPTVIGEQRDPRCIEAREMATAVFRSNAPSLLWPLPRPIRKGTRIILGQERLDISAGRGVSVDGNAFDTVESDGATLYWRKQGLSGPHFAVVDARFNWEGDWYAVYLLAPGATAGELARQLGRTQAGGKAPTSLLGDNRWAPPLVLTDVKAGIDWIIDRGELHAALPDWRVYVPTGPRLTMRCRISFGYSERRNSSMLPAAVRAFAAAADEALGPGTDEGTLHPTARIRAAVEQQWANAALRPWAVDSTQYNSSAEVQRGLSTWASRNPRRAALLRRIRQTRKSAERALANYYVSRFMKAGSSARRLSRSVIDNLLRSYFMFSKA
jgi:hypothetical protein